MALAAVVAEITEGAAIITGRVALPILEPA